MIDWEQIETVLLDMDGTLLDLYYDNYFWREYLPEKYAHQYGIDLETAKSFLYQKFDAIRSSLNWYCLDYWSETLDMDIPLLKEEVAHLIDIHPHVIDFLSSLRHRQKHIVLVTNAHQKSLALKMKHTRLGKHLDLVISAHDLGVPKENTAFWRRLSKRIAYDPQRCLLIDDNIEVLESARQYGIRHLLSVNRPDSRKQPVSSGGFPAITSFREILCR